MTKFLEKAFNIILSATFLVPSIVVPTSYIFPFIVPKIIVFRSLTAALVAIFVLLYVGNKDRFAVKPTPITLSLAFFVLSFALSTFFGTDAYHSFWDNHERMLGLFTVLHYFAYYLVVTTVLKTWTNWKWPLRLFLMFGTIVTLVGVLQIINPDILRYILPDSVATILSNEGSDRVSSLLGNAIYLGGFGLFLLFVGALLIQRERELLWRLIVISCSVVAFFAMYFSGTRGSFLGLGAGVIMALVLSAYSFRTNKKIRNSLVFILVLMFATLGILYINRQTTFVQSIPMLGRILNSSLSSGTGSTRLIAWKIAVLSWKERPIFGWGPNNFFYAFNAYYNPQSLRFGFGETWFDNAHNILLNTLTVQGIVGLVAYLGIFWCAWYMLFKNKTWREKHPGTFIVSATFLVAHLVQNLTVFENPTSYLFFMFWLAFVNSQTVEQDISEMPKISITNKTPNPSVVKNVGWFGISAVSVLLLVWVYVFNIEPANANNKTLLTLQLLGQNPSTAIASIKETLDTKSPHIDDIRSDLARSVVTILNSQTQTTPDIAKELVQLVYPALQENIALHPRDIRNHLTAAQLGQMAYVFTKNPQYIFEAEKILTDAVGFSPRRQQLIYSLSGIKAQLGKKEEAIKLLEQTIIDDPVIGENYYRLSFLYQYLGDLTKAKEIFNNAHAANVSFSDQGTAQEVALDNAIKAAGTKKK